MENVTIFTRKHAHSFEVLGFSSLYGTDKTFATIRFNLPNLGEPEIRLVPIADIRSAELRKHIPDKFAMPDKSITQMANAIRQEVNNKLAATEKSSLQVLLPQGYVQVQGQWLYTAGDLIINARENTFLPYNPHEIKFSTSGSLGESIAWLKIFCEQGPAHSAMLLCAITPFIRPITQALDLPTTIANAYIAGKSGSGKTSYAELLTSVFGQRGINLGSKKAQIAAVHSQYIDKPMLIDDFNKTSSSREYEKKLALLSELLQMTSCAGEILTDEGSMDFSRTSLVITAEELISNHSSVNRVVVINFNEPFNAKDLTYLQNHCNHYAHFLTKFIYFLCSQSSSLTEYIKTLMTAGKFNMDIKNEGKDAYIGWREYQSRIRL